MRVLATATLLVGIVYSDAKWSNVPPAMTPEQERVLNESIPLAKAASLAAEGRVLELFGHNITRQYIQQLAPDSRLIAMPAADLVELFWNEMSVAELVHSFGDANAVSANCGFDLSVSMGQNSSVFYNQWELQALGLVPVDAVNNVFTEWSETNLFHFSPFKNVSMPDEATAKSRPFYAAVNMYKGSGGNPQCGPISAVLSRQYVGDRILAAPVDTGFFQGMCSAGETTGTFDNVSLPVCDAWPNGSRPLGVPPYLSHLVEPYITYYNATQAPDIAGEHYVYYNLARLLIRLLDMQTYSSNVDEALPLTFLENTLGYFEFNPVYPIQFPSGVKMMIGMFELLWGTPEGAALQRWCVARQWPLVWAYNPAMSFFRCGADGKYPECKFPSAGIAADGDRANVRILDPFVLQHARVGHNVTISDTLIEKFSANFREFNVQKYPRDQIPGIWSLMEHDFAFQTNLWIQPLYYGACASSECIGVTINGNICVCP
eukprot:m.1256167 g.1256167  ORF g.1256167 m.1256167 type:complete len:489 (-) comp24710_c1_seq55:4164-5630(-)